MRTRPDLAALAVVALALVGIVVLAALNVPVPPVLELTATTALGIGGGVALQAATTAQAPAQEDLPSGAARAAGPAANLPAPAPQPLTSDPATGVMRVVTHAP